MCSVWAEDGEGRADSGAGAPRCEPGAPLCLSPNSRGPFPSLGISLLLDKVSKCQDPRNLQQPQPGPPSIEKSKSRGHSFLGLPACWLPQDSGSPWFEDAVGSLGGRQSPFTVVPGLPVLWVVSRSSHIPRDRQIVPVSLICEDVQKKRKSRAPGLGLLPLALPLPGRQKLLRHKRADLLGES